jgi:hypothetical protein
MLSFWKLSLLPMLVGTGVIVCFGQSTVFGDEFDNDANTGAWEDATNWENDTLPDTVTAEIFLEDVNNPLPTMNGLPTVTLSSGTHSPTLLDLGGGSDNDLGDIQLLMTGGTLNLNTDSEIGNGSDSNSAIAGSTAYFTQTGGDVVVTGGSGVNLKLSSGGDAIPMGSVYSISGGSLVSNGTIDIGGGTVGLPIPSYVPASALFEIVGTGPSQVMIEDLRTTTDGDADATTNSLGFVLDAGGVTPLVVNDDVQMENLNLQLSLSAAPPISDIVLVQADRLSNDNQFVGLPDGSDLTALFDGNFYTWTINYFDSSDDETVIDAIVLSNLRVAPIPEPSTAALCILAASMVMLRRRRC